MTNILETKCIQCGKVLGPAVFISPICAYCTIENYKKSLGKR